MIVSIFTDISINKRNGSGGYAFYIGCKTGHIKHSGRLKGKNLDSNTAEAQCIVNALAYLLRANLKPSKVFIYTDNSNVIDCFGGKLHIKGQDGSHRGGCSFYYALSDIKIAMIEYCVKQGWGVRDYNKAFSLRLVKAHTGNTDKLSVINDWCDNESRKHCIK